jgi:hypothetical protein
MFPQCKCRQPSAAGPSLSSPGAQAAADSCMRSYAAIYISLNLDAIRGDADGRFELPKPNSTESSDSCGYR